jgi:hypothetical protein
MSKESDQAFDLFWKEEGADTIDGSKPNAKIVWDKALSWCRPLAIAAIAKAKAKKKRSPRQPKQLTPTDHPSSFIPPGWLTTESWAGFEEMRKKIRKPLTDRARQLTISKLYELKSQGEDPIACLDQSVQRGWQGVFAVSRPYQNGNGNGHRQEEQQELPLTAEQKRKRKEADERLLAKYRAEADRQAGIGSDGRT